MRIQESAVFLEEQQLSIVERAQGGQVLVSAIPGATKTSTGLRAAHLWLNNGERPALLAFNREAVVELRERLGKSADKCIVITFDKLFCDVYRYCVQPTSWMTSSEADFILQEAVGEVGSEPLDLPGASRQIVKALLMGGQTVLSREVVEQFEKVVIEGSYWHLAAVRNWCKDHIDDVVKYLTTNYHVSAVFVDEAQDLDEIQWRLVRCLGARIDHMLIVGDEQQSLYAFRGAVEGGMTKFGRDNENLVRLNLTTSVRARQNLIPYLDEIRKSLFGGSQGLQPLYTGGIGILVTTFDSDPRFALETLCQDVLRTLHQVGGLEDGSISVPLPRGTLSTPETMEAAILVPTNSDVDNVASALRIEGLNVVTRRAQSDSQWAPTQWILAAMLDPAGLRFTNLPPDSSWATRQLLVILWNKITRRADHRTLNIVLASAYNARNYGVAAVLDASSRSLGQFGEDLEPSVGDWIVDSQRLIGTLQKQIGHEDDPNLTRFLVNAAVDLFQLTWLDSTTAELKRPLIVDQVYKSGLGPLDAARSLIGPTVPNKHHETKSDSIVVATIHQAKGATFDLVWCFSPKPGHFPFRGQDTFSERAKLWVGLTRSRYGTHCILPSNDPYASLLTKAVSVR